MARIVLLSSGKRYWPFGMMSIYIHHTRGMTKGSKMQRITITLDDDLMEELDRMIAEQGYQNRSEAIRDFTRAGMQQAAQKMGKSGNCVAALVYVYDHAARELSRRLVENYHGHHDLSMATLHVHLDDDNCMEVTALKGTGAEVQHFADHIIAERGVRVRSPRDDSHRSRKEKGSSLTKSPDIITHETGCRSVRTREVGQRRRWGAPKRWPTHVRRHQDRSVIWCRGGQLAVIAYSGRRFQAAARSRSR